MNRKQKKTEHQTVGQNKAVHPIHGVYDRGTTEHYDKREHYAPDGKRYCAYGGCVCTQRPMRGYDYCVKHILQDLNSPFKQCDFISKQTKKRCTNPVSLDQEDIRYCNSHKQMLGLIPKQNTYSKKKKKAKKDEKEKKQKGEKRVKKKKPKKAKEEESETDTDNEFQYPSISRRKIEYSGSETESDVPSSDDEFVAETPFTHLLRNSEMLSEEEFLRIRKERIEALLRIYYSQYKRLRADLRAKYYEFIKARERAINMALNTKDGTIKIRLKTSEDDEQPQTQNNEALKPIRLERQIYTCEKVLKYDSDKTPLCSYGNCTEKRMLLSEFCFKHILYDETQYLYTAGPGGVTDPVLINSTEESIAAEKRERGEKPKTSREKSSKKYVVLEYLKKPQYSSEPPLKKQKTENNTENGEKTTENVEQDETIKKILELIPKVQDQKLGGRMDIIQPNTLSTV